MVIDRASVHPARRVDAAAAFAVAGHYLADDACTDRALVHAAYEQLVTQTDELLQEVVRRWQPSPVRLASTEVAEPYASADELVAAVRASNVLEIPVGDPDRRHPILGCEPGGEHDRFRALHDLVGHVLHGFGFDRDGELSAWCAQHRLHRGLARWALATELHAQHSVRWTTGHLAEPKAILLDPRLLAASLGPRTPRHVRAPVTPPPAARSC